MLNQRNGNNAMISETQLQLALLRIFDENRNVLLYKLAPQISALFGFDEGSELSIFDSNQFSRVVRKMWDEWLIEIRGAALTDNKPYFNQSVCYDTWVDIARRGSAFLRTGKIPPSNTTSQRTRKTKPDTIPDTISDLVSQKAKRLKRPQNQRESKEQIALSIAVRRGQKEFRDKLLRTYGARCLITGPNIEDILEAAHIQPYASGGTFNISNGLLLRADIHTLFDLGLIAINASDMTVLVSSRLNGTIYAELAGKSVEFQQGTQERPSKSLLEEHRKSAGLSK